MVRAADLDHDGDLDLYATSQGDSKLVYLENIDGLGNFSKPVIITNSADGAIWAAHGSIDK